MPQLIDRFIRAFIVVETELKRLAGGQVTRNDSFTSLLKKSGRSTLVRRYESDLRELADLRNAILHRHRNGEYIATPHEAVVEELERIAQQFQSPLRIYPRFTHEPVCCSSSATVAEALSSMLDNEFSQLPLLDEDQKFFGLLTWEMVAKWLARKLRTEGGILSGECIGNVFAAPVRPIHRHVSQRILAIEALEIFEQSVQDGQPVMALLITANGRSNEHLLGIVTSSDLPSVGVALQMR